MTWKTHVVKQGDIKPSWVVVDASGMRLGRLATLVATMLRGKHDTNFSPHMNMGHHVIVVNASQIDVAEGRLESKKYYRHSGYPGGLKVRTLGQQMARRPGIVIERAIRGMLPRGPLGNQLFRQLHVYDGPEHPHQAQQPKEVKLT